MNKKYFFLYFATVFSFASLNFLNVTYSFVKRFIEEQFQMTSSQIGLADAIKFFGNIIGLLLYIFAYNVPKKSTPYIYCLSTALHALFIGVIALASLADFSQKWVVFAFNLLVGLTKATIWPLLLQIVKQTIFSSKQEQMASQKYKEPQLQTYKQQNTQSQKKVSKKLMIWNSLTFLGNIIGPVVCQILVYKMFTPWNFCLLVPVACMLLSSVVLGLYFFIVKFEQDPNSNSSNHVPISLGSTTEKRRVVACINLLVLLQSIHCGMMMFLPLMLFKIGYHEYEGYILAWYNVCVILGTYLSSYINFRTCLSWTPIISNHQADIALQESKIGQIDYIINHEEQDEIQTQQSLHQRSSQTLNLISLLLLLGVNTVLNWMPCPYNCEQTTLQGQMNPNQMNNHYKLIQYTLLLGLFGLFIGAPLNKYESSELMIVLAKYQAQFIHTGPETIKFLGQIGRSTSEDEKINLAKTFIGVIQLSSYFTVIFFLLLIGHIIQTNILGFFSLMSVLSAFLLILNMIKVAQRYFSG